MKINKDNTEQSNWRMMALPLELDEQGHEEKQKYQSYPVKGFINIKTGEVRLFVLEAVEKRGSEEIIKHLSRLEERVV